MLVYRVEGLGLIEKQLADEAFCKVDAEKETFLRLPMDHESLWQFEKAGVNSEAKLHRFVSVAVSESLEMISARQQACECR
jgi:hypothetical protein